MKLTEDLIRSAIALYYGMESLCKEFGYDFCGIKGQRELTEHYATSDIAEAFLNDYYGPDGTPHDPLVCSHGGGHGRRPHHEGLRADLGPAGALCRSAELLPGQGRLGPVQLGLPRHLLRRARARTRR